uniref:Putative glycoprotein n=1 Tax=Sichuan mosquito chuvirus-like virus TaxID=2864017 RepID=A0A8K1HJC6_9VIRU|nr:putative glycoprotein [Sichuan mosquito chuvirus-like virus]
MSLIRMVTCDIGLTAYNCTSHNVTYRPISLLHPKTCSLTTNEVETTQIQGMIVLTPQIYEIMVPMCRIHIVGRVDGCGIGSHSYPTKHGILDYMVYLTKEECSLLHTTNMIRIEGMDFSSLKPNDFQTFQQNYANIYNGACMDDNVFTLNNVQYSDAYAQLSISIYYTNITSIWDVNKDHLQFTDGSVCYYKDDTCLLNDGSTLGNMKLEGSLCGLEKDNIVYQGTMNITSVTYSKTKNFSANDVITVNLPEFTFSTILTAQDPVCHFYETETQELVFLPINTVPLLTDNEQGHDKVPVLQHLIQSRLNMEIKTLTYIINENFQNLYTYLMQRKCEDHYKVSKLQLSLAYSDPQTFAYDYMQQPGYTAIVQQEIIYLIQCQPVQVLLRSNVKCSINIPVYYKEQEMFITPRNHILTREGGETHCSSQLLSAVYVKDKWYTTQSAIYPVTDITNLNTDDINNSDYKPLFITHRQDAYALNEQLTLHKMLNYHTNQKTFTSNTIGFFHNEQFLHEESSQHYNYLQKGWNYVKDHVYFSISNWIPWWIYVVGCLLLLPFVIKLLALVVQLFLSISKIINILYKVTIQGCLIKWCTTKKVEVPNTNVCSTNVIPTTQTITFENEIKPQNNSRIRKPKRDLTGLRI